MHRGSLFSVPKLLCDLQVRPYFAKQQMSFHRFEGTGTLVLLTAERTRALINLRTTEQITMMGMNWIVNFNNGDRLRVNNIDTYRVIER